MTIHSNVMSAFTPTRIKHFVKREKRRFVITCRLAGVTIWIFKFLVCVAFDTNLSHLTQTIFSHLISSISSPLATANSPTHSMINQLPADCLSAICSFLPLFDKWSDDVPFRFISNIGIEDEDVGLFVLQSFYHNNMHILQGLLNSNLSAELVDIYLHFWNSYQPHSDTTFCRLINSIYNAHSKLPSHQRYDGLEKIVFTFVTQDGERLDRNVIQDQLLASIVEKSTSYGIPVLLLSMDGTIVRSIDNRSLFGLSKDDVVELCLEKFDYGHTAIDMFVTTASSRSRCLDVVFTNPVVGILNNLESITQAWTESASNSTSCVSKEWRAQLLSLRNNDPRIMDVALKSGDLNENDMYLSSNSMDIIFGENGRNDIPMFEPIVQIVHMKRIPNVDDLRWKIVISDGTHFYHGIVPRHLAHHVDNGEIKLFAIIRVLDFISTTTPNGFYIFIPLRIQFLYHHRHSIGHPVDVTNPYIKRL